MIDPIVSGRRTNMWNLVKKFWRGITPSPMIRIPTKEEIRQRERKVAGKHCNASVNGRWRPVDVSGCDQETRK